VADAFVLAGYDEVTGPGDVAVRELDQVIGGNQAEGGELGGHEHAVRASFLTGTAF
jgi:hypothetical protein